MSFNVTFLGDSYHTYTKSIFNKLYDCKRLYNFMDFRKGKSFSKFKLKLFEGTMMFKIDKGC